MRKVLILLLLVVISLAGCNVTGSLGAINNEEISIGTEVKTIVADEMGDYSLFFEKDVIHEINIEISESDFEDILANPLDEVYHEATVTLDGVEVSSVGFRTKGNSTLRDVANSDSERYSFKIKMNEYIDQDLLGLDEFVINNMYSDASYLREYISYEAMAENGLNVPLSSFVDVYINGELYGFYLLVESVDDSFLERNFGNNDGNLYRADTGTSLAIVDNEYIENVDQKNGDDESKTDLYEFMDILNSMVDGQKGNIESVLDVESALRYIATNTLLENYDSLNGQHLSNYYLYNDNGKFVVIPWDYNMSFGGFGGSGQSTVDIDNPISGITEASPLIKNLLEVEDYKEMYYEILEEYIDYFDDFESKVTNLSDLIRENVTKDPSKFTSMENFEATIVYQEDGAVEVASMNDMGQVNRMTPSERPSGPPTGDASDRPMAPPTGGIGSDNKMAGNDVSIINVLLARIENIMDQLSNK